MSRTRRNYPHWINWSNNYDQKLQRDNNGTYPIQTYDGLWGEEVWGRRGKKREKKLRSRMRRNEKKNVIQKEIKELDEAA